MTTKQVRMSRQAGMIKDPGDISLLIIGAGGIGSNALHMALSIGYENILIADPDRVEDANIFPGHFMQDDIGGLKTTACRENAAQLGVDIRTLTGTVRPELDDIGRHDIVLICTDSLRSRKDIWRKMARRICGRYWIDARMGGRVATVYTLNMRNRTQGQHYNTVLANAIPAQLPCGMKATAPLTKGFIAGMIGQSLADIANGEEPMYTQRYDMQVRMFLNVAPMEDERVSAR